MNLAAWLAVMREAKMNLEIAKAKRKTAVMDLVIARLRDQIPAEEARAKVLRLMPDQAERKEISELLRKQPSQPADTGRAPKTQGKNANDKNTKVRERAWTSAQKGMDFLAKAAVRGDAEAAVHLAEIASEATRVLSLLVERLYPEHLRETARRAIHWPVLAVPGSDWETDARKRIAELEVGQFWLPYKVKFKKGRGADENYPARLWAKRAVRAIEGTKARFLSAAALSLSPKEEVAMMAKKGFRFDRWPQWVLPAVRLPAFSKATTKAWGEVIRAMIREQVPNFHELPEWTDRKRSLESRGRKGIGELQNKILDDIVSALETIAP